jgi:hypothetical protein
VLGRFAPGFEAAAYARAPFGLARGENIVLDPTIQAYMLT